MDGKPGTPSGAGGPRPVSQERRPYYLGLIALYNVIFGIFLLVYRRLRHPLPQVSPFDVGLLGFATLRMAKMISEDEITRVLREPIAVEREGERQPRGEGLRASLGKLVLCPTCLGTWVAAFLTYALHISPRYTRPFLAIMSASAFEQFTDAVLSLVYTDRNARRKEEALLEHEVME